MSFDEDGPTTTADPVVGYDRAPAARDVAPAHAFGGRSAARTDAKAEGGNERAPEHGNDRSSNDKEGSSEETGGSEPPRSKKPLIILAIAVVVIAILALIYWFLHRNQVSTDDAYTDGDAITMAPKVSGYVIELDINDNARVHKGDLLLRIEADDYRASQAQGEAALALAKAELQSAETALKIAKVQYPAQYASAIAQRQSAVAAAAQAKAQFRREHEVDRRATTQENIDASTSQQLSSAASVKTADTQVAIAALVPDQIEQASNTVVQREAQVKQAEAQLTQSNLNVGYTEVRAPADGVVTMRSVQLGSYLKAGDTMFLLVTPNVWVTANFKESQLGRMRVGDNVDLEVDAYSSLHLRGHVQSIQFGSGSKFSAFPAENATGNFVKIVQRVPVKIVIDSGIDPDRELPLGLSVDPVVFVQ